MPSSSSSDEDLAKFKEAADSSLYNDSLFKGNQALEEEPSTAHPPSLRCVDVEENDHIHGDLRVTPAFQKHVAKKLSKLLDSQIDSESIPKSSRSVLKAKRRKPVCSSEDDTNSSGVRLFGASAVFLSSMNILPLPPQRRQRGRKIAHLTRGSDSSSEDSDSDSMKNMSAAAVSPNWLLSGEATKGWTNSKGKVERCMMDKSGSLIPITNGFEALSEVNCSNNNSKEVNTSMSKPRSLREMVMDKMLKDERKREHAQVDSELAASFSSVVSIGSDSQGDVSNPPGKHKRHKRRKKQRKEQYSEDATTENTEVEEVVERRKKKCKKGRKKPKCQRVEEKESEEAQMIKDCVPGLLEENDTKWKALEKKKRKTEKKRRCEIVRDESYLKLKRPSTGSKRRTSAKFLRKKIRNLSDDLAKLMMTPEEISQD